MPSAQMHDTLESHNNWTAVLTTMLLPSAIPCGPISVPSRPQRPSLPTFSVYQPRTTTQSPTPNVPGVLASCDSLQAVLGTALPPSPVAKSLPNPFDQPLQRLSNQVMAEPIPLPSRGVNKRARDEFEEGNEDDVEPSCQMMEDVNLEEEYSTPKRRRRLPLSMPLGLSAADFRSLGAPALPTELHMPRRTSNESSKSLRDDDSGYGQSPAEEDSNWTNEDDRILVETVLERLRLSKNDWNDCARILGRNKDSLGKRWKMLVGDGDVGLRRRGRIRRTDLDIQSW